MSPAIKTPLCQVCGKEIPRGKDEDNCRYLSRVACSLACGCTMKGERPADLLPKHCECCGKDFTREQNLRLDRWRRQRFCSVACASQERERVKLELKKKNPEPVNRCAVCGVEFSRRKTEQLNNYRRRTACTPQCALTTIKNARKLADTGQEWRVPRVSAIAQANEEAIQREAMMLNPLYRQRMFRGALGV